MKISLLNQDKSNVKQARAVFLVGLSILTLGLVAKMTGSARADGLPHPVLVEQVPANVFVPKGFDSNDNAQVVLDGNLINTCYKEGPYKVAVDQSKKRIIISNQNYVYPGDWCAQIQSPYLKTVDVGVLEPAQYSIFVRNGSQPLSPAGQLEIVPTPNAHSPFGPDDYLYAPVSDAFMQDPNDPSNRKLVLRGVFPDGCMALDAPKLSMINQVIVVLPIAKHPGTACSSGGPQNFETIIDLATAPKGRQLIHVRSMNGKSLNRVVTFQ